MKIEFRLTIEVYDNFPKVLAQKILSNLEEALVTGVELSLHDFDVADTDCEFSEEGDY